jgi:hypothetical protein
MTPKKRKERSKTSGKSTGYTVSWWETEGACGVSGVSTCRSWSLAEGGNEDTGSPILEGGGYLAGT